MDDIASILGDRRKKLEQLRERGVDPYCQDFSPKQEIGSLVDQYSSWEGIAFEDLKETFSVAGRLMAKRDFGKVTFMDLMDRTGKIQCLVQSHSLATDQKRVFDCLNVGDHLGVQGRLFRTRTGELTVRVESLRILSKALRPLPEKWHGIRDVETRYRKRYLDLIMNPQVRECFQTRTRVLRWMREFLDGKGFQEVETPMMQPLPGGAEARPFITHHNALDVDLYLRIAPELYLKRLVIGGFERVYEINRNFRNEGISTHHNPEFTMLEFYQAYATFDDLMILTEDLLETLLFKLQRGQEIEYQGRKLDFSRPWRRVRFLEALEDIGEIPHDRIGDEEGLRQLVRERGLEFEGGVSLGKMQAKLFDSWVEPHLINPTFVTHYPVEISPLSRRNSHQPHLVDRFELFIGGLEIANAFTELTDPDDQRARFLEQKAKGDFGDEEAHPLDEDFLLALEQGMPPTAGEGIGIDRLMMLLADSASIRDVILFPLMRKVSG
jgi:lysyl-tRNA synthetase class 2